MIQLEKPIMRVGRFNKPDGAGTFEDMWKRKINVPEEAKVSEEAAFTFINTVSRAPARSAAAHLRHRPRFIFASISVRFFDVSRDRLRTF